MLHTRDKKRAEGAVVDPEVVESIAELENGASEAYIGDASSKKDKKTIEIMNWLGYNKIDKKTGAKLIDLFSTLHKG